MTGALLDLLDFALLSAALFILVRRRRPAVVVVSGALMLGGWGSDLLDRLGMHYWTASGSVRGVVDFIRAGEARYNVADLFIVGATPLFLLAVGFLSWRADRPDTLRAAAARHRPRASMLALAAASLIGVAVALGAANYGGVRTAPAHVSPRGIGLRAQSWPRSAAALRSTRSRPAISVPVLAVVCPRGPQNCPSQQRIAGCASG